MTSAENSKATFLLLIHCLLFPPLCCGGMVRPCFVVHHLVSHFAIISLGKKVNWPLYLNCLLMSLDSECSVSLPQGAVGSCDRGVSLSYLLTFSCDLLSSILKN